MPKRATKTSFPAGVSGNPTGVQGVMPEAYRAKERLLSAIMASTTHDELVTASRKLFETGDRDADKYLKMYISASSGLKVLSPEDREEQKVRIEKNKAERDLAKQTLQESGGSPQNDLAPELGAIVGATLGRLGTLVNDKNSTDEPDDEET